MGRISCRIRGLDRFLFVPHRLAHAGGALPVIVALVAELRRCTVLVRLAHQAAAGA